MSVLKYTILYLYTYLTNHSSRYQLKNDIVLKHFVRVREDMGGDSGGQRWVVGLLRAGHHPEGQEEEDGGETGQVQVGHDEAFIPSDRHE